MKTKQQTQMGDDQSSLEKIDSVILESVDTQ